MLPDALVYPVVVGSLLLRVAAVGLGVVWTVKLRDQLMAAMTVFVAAYAAYVFVLIGPAVPRGAGPRGLITGVVTGIGILVVVHFVGRTVAQRRSNLEILKRTEEESRATLEGISDAVFITDENGQFTHLWPNIELIFGYSTSEVLEFGNVRKILGEQFQLPTQLDPGSETGNIECDITDKPGESRTLLVNAKRTHIQRGSLLFTCRDITQRKRDLEALREAHEEVRRLNDQLEAENIYFQEEIKRDHNFEEIIGTSAGLRDVLEKVEQVAGTDTTVLILGETGVGKELFARAVHNLSRRRDRPLAKVNCASLPATLIESELFGHEKGAFTGAVGRKAGRFELADGGTIFLDEIGELPLDLQAKLLRVVQEGELERLGSTKTTKVDVRIIAATNRDLARDAEQGRFRPDLFFRLNVFPLEMPPLRERIDDVPHLAKFFLGRFMVKQRKNLDGFSKGAMQQLMAYRWPGNVRELENVIERAVVAATGSVLRIEPLGGDDRTAAGEEHRPASSRLDDVERAHFTSVLEQTNWMVQGDRGAAAILGINPSTLRSRMKKLKIQKAQ